MKKKSNKNDIDPADLPQSEVFTRKEIFQHPQPQDQGKALDPNPKQRKPTATNSKEEQKTSKKEGLNEEQSEGTAGAFEGFEDQQQRE